MSPRLGEKSLEKTPNYQTLSLKRKSFGRIIYLKPFSSTNVNKNPQTTSSTKKLIGIFSKMNSVELINKIQVNSLKSILSSFSRKTLCRKIFSQNFQHANHQSWKGKDQIILPKLSLKKIMNLITKKMLRLAQYKSTKQHQLSVIARLGKKISNPKNLVKESQKLKKTSRNLLKLQKLSKIIGS